MSCTESESSFGAGSGMVMTCITGERAVLVSESESVELGSSVSETSGEQGPTIIFSGTGSRVGTKGILFFFLEDDLVFLLLFKAGFLLCLTFLLKLRTWATDLICLGGEEVSVGMSSSMEVSPSNSSISRSEMPDT